MLQNLQTVYCDMTTTPNEGWTLIVTSADSGWSREQVLLNQSFHLDHDPYSAIFSWALS